MQRAGLSWPGPLGLSKTVQSRKAIMGLCTDKLSPLRKDLGYACPRISRNDSITLQTVMSLDGELNKSILSMDLCFRPSGVRLEISSQFDIESKYIRVGSFFFSYFIARRNGVR